jgi:MoaA/NifB/PqqE/SkfB family radical SAM enzyme
VQHNPVKDRNKSTLFKSVSGINRVLFLIGMKIRVFFYFVHRLFSGKISLQFFFTALSNLDQFSRRQSISKFIKFDNGIRTGLYVPTFSSPGYFLACEKMFEDSDTMGVIIAVLSISKKCCYSCDYCYQHYDDPDNEMPLPILLETIEQIKNDGAVIFKLEGGEPFLSYDRLKSVCKKIDRRSEIWINTTGVGSTYERLVELKELGVTAYKISIHYPNKNDYNAFFGKDDAWDIMIHTIENLNKLNIPYSFNTFFKPDDYYNGKFETIMNLARDWGASYIQCLTPRVAGGNIHNTSIVLTEKELDKLGTLLYQYNRNRKYKEYPPIRSDTRR